jgi:RNA polymerase sigma-70 factor, ECF subfamily
MLTDEELMLSVAKGNRGAFEEIVRRHQRSAWNTACRFLGDVEEARDVVQDTFLKILDAAPRYQPTALFKTYLYCIIARLCLDRARKKRPIYTDDLADDLPQMHDPRPSASERLLTRERDRAVAAALDTLPPNQRMAVILKYYEGLGYQEISQAMQITEKAVERLLARARASLQAALLDLVKK